MHDDVTVFPTHKRCKSFMSSMLQESTVTSEPRWGGKRSSAAGRKAPVTSRMCLTSRGKWDRKYCCFK